MMALWHTSVTPIRERDGITDLIRDLYRQSIHLVQQEMKLLKIEGQAAAKKATQVGLFGLMALHFASLFTMFLGLSLILILFSLGIPLLWASILVTGFMMVVSGVLVALAYVRLKKGYPDLFEGDKILE